MSLVSIAVYNARQSQFSMPQMGNIASGATKTKTFKRIDADDILGEFDDCARMGVLVLEDGVAPTGGKLSTDGANYTAGVTEQVHVVDTDASGVTITLPAVASVAVGHRIWVYLRTKVTGNIVVDGNAAELVLGAATQTLTTAGSVLRLQNSGTAWVAPTSLA